MIRVKRGVQLPKREVKALLEFAGTERDINYSWGRGVHFHVSAFTWAAATNGHVLVRLEADKFDADDQEFFHTVPAYALRSAMRLMPSCGTLEVRRRCLITDDAVIRYTPIDAQFPAESIVAILDGAPTSQAVNSLLLDASYLSKLIAVQRAACSGVRVVMPQDSKSPLIFESESGHWRGAIMPRREVKQ